jgi:hypothetical protein
MSVAEHSESVQAAIGLLSRAHRKALAEAKGRPESTWIDAACAIGAAEAQLLAAQPSVIPGLADEGADRDTCIALLQEAEQALARIPAGQGPVSLTLIRAYLTDAIIETAGREL